MTDKEAIEVLQVAKAEVEWEYPLDYQIAFDKAIKALEQEDILSKVRNEIIELRSKQNVGVLECLDIIDKYKGSKE